MDSAHTVVLNDAVHAGGGGKAMQVAGSGALTAAAVVIPAVWLRRLRDAPRLRRNMELRITITRDDGRGDDVAHLQRFPSSPAARGQQWQQQPPSAVRAHGDSGWPHSVFMDGESGGQSQQQHGVHFVEGGWDPASVAGDVASAVRYEHELVSEAADAVVTLLVKPWFVRDWATDVVRFTFRGHWRAQPSWVRVRAAVWERVALHESFRPGRDARHRCEIDGAPVCHSDRHFEHVPLDEGNIERADRLAQLYYSDLGEPGPLGSAASEELTRLRIENARLSALVAAQRTASESSPVTPRQVVASERHFFGGGGGGTQDSELVPLPRASPIRKTPSRKVMDAPSTPQQQQQPQPLPSPSEGGSGETHYHIQSATFLNNPLQSPGATIVRGQGELEPHFAIRVQPSPVASSAPRSPAASPGPASPSAAPPRGRLAPLQVHTGDSVAPSPHPHSNRTFGGAGASPFRRPPLPSPAHAQPPRDDSGDPFLAHYAPEVDHFSSRSYAQTGAASAATAAPASSASNGVHFFSGPLHSPQQPMALANLPPLPPSTMHAHQHVQPRPSPFAYPGFINTPQATPHYRGRNNFQ